MASCQHPHSAAKSPNDFSREKPLPQPLNQPFLPIPILGCCEAPPSRGERETYNTDTRVVDRATSNNWGTSARGTSACGAHEQTNYLLTSSRLWSNLKS